MESNNRIRVDRRHFTTFITAVAGSVIHGGMFAVPEALGNKIIHPYSDFLLHDVGTGDGIIQGDPSTENKMRTPPLWGLHMRPRLMHDGDLATVTDAINRHGGEAKLSPDDSSTRVQERAKK